MRPRRRWWERALVLAGELGLPVVGLIHSVGIDPRSMGGLAGWGRVARQAVTLSGVVPILLAVTGPCHGGLVSILGLADHVVLTTEASTYINGPASVAAISGLHVTPAALGGAWVHARTTRLATLVVA
ncbi:MAG: carboxyl transferase domain-containing protein, partial [Acidimicrobiales bacterium]